MDEIKKMSAFDAFSQVQETYQDAEVKAKEEESKSFAKIPNFTMKKDGTYKVRILPNAPIFKDGVPQPLDRKSYEYPTKTIFLNIQHPTDAKKKMIFPVTNAKLCGFSEDLIDAFVAAACSKYADDEKLVEKIKSNTMSGGLKWNSQRCMYVIDTEDVKSGIQMLSLSYSQYKDLEKIKMEAWKEILADDPHAGCPISSLTDASPINIIRKTENTKTSYQFSIARKPYPLEEKTLNELIEFTRLPEALYRYTRFQFEATIEFLKQYEEKVQISVMEEDSVKEAMQKISSEMQADDKSHFSFDKKKTDDKSDNSEDSKELSFESLADRYDKYSASDLDEKSEEMTELREDIAQYIDDNDLDIRVSRKKSNADLLDEISELLDEQDNKKDKAEDKEAVSEVESPDDTDEVEDDGSLSESPVRGERNDDTNEPAVSADRRPRAARERRGK